MDWIALQKRERSLLGYDFWKTKLSYFSLTVSRRVAASKTRRARTPGRPPSPPIPSRPPRPPSRTLSRPSSPPPPSTRRRRPRGPTLVCLGRPKVVQYMKRCLGSCFFFLIFGLAKYFLMWTCHGLFRELLRNINCGRSLQYFVHRNKLLISRSNSWNSHLRMHHHLAQYLSSMAGSNTLCRLLCSRKAWGVRTLFSRRLLARL